MIQQSRFDPKSLPVCKFLEKLTQLRRIANQDDWDRACELCKQVCTQSLTPVNDAAGYCIECQQKICSQCWNYHRVTKPTRNHVVVVLGTPEADAEQILKDRGEQEPQRKMYCSYHSERPAELYCCDTPICNECLLLHATHEFQTLTDAAQRYRAELQNYATKLSELFGQYAEYHQKLKAVENDITRIENQVKNGTEELKRKIDEDCEKLLSQLQQYRRKNETMKDKFKLSSLHSLGKAKNLSHEVSRRGSVNEVLLLSRNVKESAEKLLQSREVALRLESISRPMFEVNEDFSDQIKDLHNALGCLYLCKSIYILRFSCVSWLRFCRNADAAAFPSTASD